MMTRAETLTLVQEYTKNQNLIKHMLAVEAAMKHYARKYGENEETWGLVGLIHDFDYEKFPNKNHSPTEEHPSTGVKILRENGWPEELCQAILGHAEYCDAPRTTKLAQTLYAVDELTGFIVATALVRPNKSLAEVDVESVKKKWTDKSFARGVHREQIEKGAQELGVPLDEHIQHVLTAMQGIAPQLGL
ncbi:HDIG domain-containing protein [Candidatus Acetothermia bacterium]|nr:HDIG domain-containing protein [Candidatus Acetothermia bacterium]MBI3461372.1 HDIG domain-containing protein [Candidatus Acetothermia bacterium]MBI3661053.1 HDIG domain-containing protein [Candidatus Acetothermia bacterium]